MARRSLVLIAVLAACVLGLLGCDDDDDAGATSAGTYVGEVEGSDAYIALVTDGENVSGYLSDGTPKGVDVYYWIGASAVSDGSATLVARFGEPIVGEAEFADDEVSGQVVLHDLGGKRVAFTAELASGEAGLYSAAARRAPGEHALAEAGWILAADGSQRGAVGFTIPNAPPRLRPVPLIDATTDIVPIHGVGTMSVSQITDPFGI